MNTAKYWSSPSWFSNAINITNASHLFYLSDVSEWLKDFFSWIEIELTLTAITGLFCSWVQKESKGYIELFFAQIFKRANSICHSWALFIKGSIKINLLQNSQMDQIWEQNKCHDPYDLLTGCLYCKLVFLEFVVGRLLKIKLLGLIKN